MQPLRSSFSFSPSSSPLKHQAHLLQNSTASRSLFTSPQTPNQGPERAARSPSPYRRSTQSQGVAAANDRSYLRMYFEPVVSACLGNSQWRCGIVCHKVRPPASPFQGLMMYD
jgi:hypothetical protein